MAEITVTSQGIPLIQRDPGETTGTAIVEGTFDESPTSISAEIRRVSDDAVIVEAVVIDDSPSGGTYAGEVSGIPESLADSYYVVVTAAGTEVSDSSKGDWEFQVGRWVGVIGQSNGGGMFDGAATPPSAAAGTYYYDTTSFASVPNANGVRELLNGLVARTGAPWGCVQYCVAGVNRSFYDEGGAGFTTFMGRVESGPGDLECLLWVHGESAAVGEFGGTGGSDSTSNRAPVLYAVGMGGIQSAIADSIGRTAAQLPMVLGSLSCYTSGGYSDIQWWRAQACLWYSTIKNEHIHYSHSNLDITLTDGLHWDAASQGRHGARAALAIAHVLGDEAGSAAWGVTACARVGHTETTVTMSQSVGGDFTGTDITGFEVSHDGFHWIPAIGQRVNSTTIALTHDPLPYINRAVRFGYGRTPDMTNPPRETELDASPIPSICWVTTGEGENPIFQITEAGRTQTPSSTSPEVNDILVPNAEGNAVLYGAFTGHSANGISDCTVNGNATTAISTVSSSPTSTARLFSYDMGVDYEADWACTYSNTIFTATPTIFVTLLRGSLSPLDAVAARANSATSATLNADVADGGLVMAVATSSGDFSSDDVDATLATMAAGRGLAGTGNKTIADSVFTATNGSSINISLAAFTFESPPDEIAPELESATVAANRTKWTLKFNEPVVGESGFSATGSTTGAIALTYVSGSGTDELVFEGTEVVPGETITLDYDDETGDVEDLAGNPLAAIEGAAVVNNGSESAGAAGSLIFPSVYRSPYKSVYRSPYSPR